MKIGKQEGCMCDDRIDIEVSPTQLEDLIDFAQDKAMREENYSLAGLFRDLKDVLQGRYDKWRDLRNKSDMISGET